MTDRRRADGAGSDPVESDLTTGPSSGADVAAPGDAIVRGTDVVKEYETGDQTVRALKGIDFEIDPADFVAVVGPSGSGKSTLLNLLGLLDVPTSGAVRLRGVDVATLSDRERTRERKRTIGFVFQSFYLIPTLTALENVEVPRMLDRTPGRTRERATELLERVDLGDRLDHHPDELSGGQKQRVAIARSLINDPDVVLADEPTGNLDRDTGDRILDLFDELRTVEDVAVVTVTHDDYVAEAADRVVNLIDGEVRNRDAAGGHRDREAAGGPRGEDATDGHREEGAAGERRGGEHGDGEENPHRDGTGGGSG